MPRASGDGDTATQACLQCRLSKIKCSQVPGQLSCQRCSRFSFDCVFKAGRRGRKPRSKADFTQRRKPAEPSLVDADSSPDKPTILSNAAARKQAWKMLTRSSANRGSTYTFVAAGRAEMASLEEGSHFSSAGQHSLPTPTLRQLLQRLDAETTSSSHPRALMLPTIIDREAPRDPCLAGIVTKERAHQLFHYFNQHLSPWLAVLNPKLQVSDIESPILLSAILLQASKCISKSGTPEEDETVALEKHCRTLATLAFLEADTRQEVALAFYILSAWKVPDDDSTDLYTGFADRIEIMNRKSVYLSGSELRSRERIQYFHYVQQNVFMLHYGPSTTFSRQNDLVRQTLSWSQAQDSFVGDWFLCSDVESTAIQCRYKSLFEDQQHQHGATYTALLEAFLDDLYSWESRWRIEASRREKKEQDANGNQLRLAGLKLFRNSVCTQISSIALCETLRAWLRGEQMDSPAHVKRCYDICLDSCMGVLESILDLGSNPSLLLHMPDSLILLTDHASMLIVYLLLVPAITADQQTESRGLFAKTKIDPVSEHFAHECIERIKRVKRLIKDASSLCSNPNTALALSADYLDSIISLMEGYSVDTEREVQRTIDGFTQAADISMDDFDLGWDWLQSVLQYTTTTMAAPVRDA